MPIYKIADLNIKIEPLYELTRQRLLPYLTNAETADFDASASKEEISELSKTIGFSAALHYVEDSVVLKKICDKVLAEYNGFFFHSSCLIYNRKAYVFTAQSGTGKSTHTALWRKRFGDKVVMINDDKPIIRKTDGRFLIYGTPWMGKAEIGNNISSEIEAVYILRRSAQNKSVRVSPGKVFTDLINATIYPSDGANAVRLLELYDEFFSSTPLFVLNCNTEPDAVDAALNAAKNLSDKRND